MKNYFLIEIELNANFRNDFESSTGLMNQLLSDGKIQTYGLSEEITRMWITMVADSTLEVWETIGHLHLHSIMEPIVTPLQTYNQSIDLFFPSVSLN